MKRRCLILIPAGGTGIVTFKFFDTSLVVLLAFFFKLYQPGTDIRLNTDFGLV
jgi:hypothetical protein